jgi:hypothetical protein
MRQTRRSTQRKKSKPQEQKQPTNDSEISSATVVTPQASTSRLPAKDPVVAMEADSQQIGNEPAGENVDVKESPAQSRIMERFRKIKLATEKRWEKLQTNKEWVWETYKLKFQLEPFAQKNLDQLKQFFTPTFFVTAQNFQAMKSRIAAVKDKELKSLLEKYIQYAIRYNVVFTLRQGEPRFLPRSIGYGLNKFHVAVRQGRIEPIGGIPPWEEASPLPRSIPSDDFDIALQTPMADDFESDELPVPEGLQELVDAGKAKYILIEDEDDASPLRQVGDFGYSPDQVTVIDYKFGEPEDLRSRRFLLVGENVPLNEAWPKLREMVASYQRDYAKHDQRGRATDVRQLKSYLDELVRGGDTLQNIAAKFVKDKESPGYVQRLATMMSRLSQLKKKLQE